MKKMSQWRNDEDKRIWNVCGVEEEMKAEAYLYEWKCSDNEENEEIQCWRMMS